MTAKALTDKKYNIFYEWFVALTGLSFFLFAGLLITITGLCLKPFLSESKAHHFGRKSMHYGTRMFFALLNASGIVLLDFDELDKLRDESGIIITPNHPCLMDALFIASRLPNVVCVMKGSVMNNPLFFGVASLGGFIHSDSSASFIQKCKESIDDGAQLLLFPEGTRTLTETVNPFKGGFSLIAQITGAPVQSVFIEANTNFLGKTWPLWKKPSFPLIYRTTLGERFTVNEDQDHRAFTKELENYFKTHLINL